MKKYKIEWININAEDCPCRLTNLKNGKVREYVVEGVPWRILSKIKEGEDEAITDSVFQKYKSDIKIEVTNSDKTIMDVINEYLESSKKETDISYNISQLYPIDYLSEEEFDTTIVNKW